MLTLADEEEHANDLAALLSTIEQKKDPSAGKPW